MLKLRALPDNEENTLTWCGGVTLITWLACFFKEGDVRIVLAMADTCGQILLGSGLTVLSHPLMYIKVLVQVRSTLKWQLYRVYSCTCAAIGSFTCSYDSMLTLALSFNKDKDYGDCLMHVTTFPLEIGASFFNKTFVWWDKCVQFVTCF